MGVPQLTAVHNVTEALKGTGVPMIADGIPLLWRHRQSYRRRRQLRDAGRPAHGTEEAPGEMSSTKAARSRATVAWARWAPCSEGSSDRYFQDNEANADKLVPKVSQGRVPTRARAIAKSSTNRWAACARPWPCGCATIDKIRETAEFVEISAGMHRIACTRRTNHQRKAPTIPVD